MATASFQRRRGQLETYFNRTAAKAWQQLTSDAPVSRIRATVRAGRDRMRAMLIDWLPADLTGARLLDAGCGTGALAVEAARRGAHVLAIDVASNLLDTARERLPNDLAGQVDFRVGDMLAFEDQTFDYTVAMDSLIHYELADVAIAVERLARQTRSAVLFTFAPSNPLLAAMHGVGRLFPRGNRAPSIVPLAEPRLRRALDRQVPQGWRTARTERIASGFYTSQAMEVITQ